jgi:hypothetical protein
MFFQMVDRLDQGLVPAELGPLDYKGLYDVRALLHFLHDTFVVQRPGCSPFRKKNLRCVIIFGVFWFQAVSKALFRAHVEGQLKVVSGHFYNNYVIIVLIAGWNVE